MERTRVRSLFILILFGVTSTAISASVQLRTFDPTTQKFYAGLGQNAWGFTDAICGVQLSSNADCWGNFVAYVRESTPGGKMICSSLMAAKTLSVSVNYYLDVTAASQCEIIKVEM